MRSTVIDRPNWFDREYVDRHFNISRKLSKGEIYDLYGFVNGILNDKADGPIQVVEELEQENIRQVNEFAQMVDEGSLRYSIRGEQGDPYHLGRYVGGNRESRSFSQSNDSAATKDPNPEESSFTSGRKVNMNRLENQGELDRSVHHGVREEEEKVKLILDGKVENLHSDRIELDGYKDLTLDELRDEYGELFEEGIKNLERGEIESDGPEDLPNISTVVYDNIVAE